MGGIDNNRDVHSVFVIQLLAHFEKFLPVCDAVVDMFVCEIIVNHLMYEYITQVLLTPVIITGDVYLLSLQPSTADDFVTREHTACPIGFEKTNPG